ncbi:hypothetical protein GW17_00011154 [Ensete ventricosum]|nr:hypothetical protein GW17_00011154 [Ensete ventricosum]RZS04108.1 hypothetical protein BHM03_00034389 [Ensete ventricosum]
MKRRPMLQLEGNNDDGKGREEGTKMRATAVVATHAGGRRRVTVGVEKHGRKKAATMLRKREQGRRGRAVEAMVVSDRGRLKERVVAVAAGATTGKGHRQRGIAAVDGCMAASGSVGNQQQRGWQRKMKKLREVVAAGSMAMGKGSMSG